MDPRGRVDEYPADCVDATLIMPEDASCSVALSFAASEAWVARATLEPDPDCSTFGTFVRLTALTGDDEFSVDLVELESIRVEPIASVIRGALPSPLQPGDLVVRFTLTSAGRDPLAILAPDGQGMVVVRPGEDPRVIAR